MLRGGTIGATLDGGGLRLSRRRDGDRYGEGDDLLYGGPPMVSIETVFASHRPLLSAATAARQVWLTKLLATTDETDDFINRNVMLNLVNTES